MWEIKTNPSSSLFHQLLLTKKKYMMMMMMMMKKKKDQKNTTSFLLYTLFLNCPPTQTLQPPETLNSKHILNTQTICQIQRTEVPILAAAQSHSGVPVLLGTTLPTGC